MKTKQTNHKPAKHSSNVSLPVRPGKWRQRKLLQEDEAQNYYQNGSLIQDADPSELGGLAVSGW